MLENIKFDQNDIQNALAKLDDSKVDELTFGAVKVDKDGKILAYNEAESQITGRKKENVLGKNFFTEVAPCTKTDIFYGKFKEGVEKGDLNVLFEYTFDYQMAPTKVKVHMKKSLTDEHYWIFVKRL